MEFMRDDDDDNKVESLTDTSSEDKIIIDSGAETESRHGDPIIELETPEAWPDHLGRKNTSGKWLTWCRVIGEHSAL